MSALPPKADINRGERYVCFVPIADKTQKRRPAEVSPKPISADYAAAATSSLTPRVPKPRSRIHAAATLIVPSRLSTITGE